MVVNEESREGIANKECDQCDRKFAHKGSLSKHKKSVHEEITYECDLCHRRFTQSHNLKRHKEGVHQGKRKYECKECYEKFKQCIDLKRHKLRVHENVTYNCDVCDRTFAHYQSLNSHRKVHQGVKKYECKECGNH